MEKTRPCYAQPGSIGTLGLPRRRRADGVQEIGGLGWPGADATPPLGGWVGESRRSAGSARAAQRQGGGGAQRECAPKAGCGAQGMKGRSGKIVLR